MMKSVFCKLLKLVSVVFLASAVSACSEDGSSGGNPISNFGGNPNPSIVSNPISIISSGAGLECAYLTWSPASAASKYNVYVKGASDSDWKMIDKELIRGYSNSNGGTSVDYYRADILGLKAASYSMKVVEVLNDQETSNYKISPEVSPVAQDRSGFAFTGTQTPGAYKADGTLKDGANVLYISKDNAKTVKFKVEQDKGLVEFTGLQAILDAYQKGKDHRPLSIRLLGKISLSDLDKISSAAEGLQIKGNKFVDMPITLEGVGDDATIWGFGILVRGASYVELKNFAVMYCIDDCISIDTDDSHLWVHNLDLFYGKGGSGDKAKGDGSLDSKGATMCTYSYNHFWDTGKCNLLENGTVKKSYEEGAFYLTYHHNWYDHSDSRHPRVRYDNVHVYNNYYDGNSKYGVGACMGGSVFVESNYFRNCKFPMLTSMQGNDLYAGSGTYSLDNGTFSSEEGGVIKSFGNFITGNSASYVPYNATKAYIKGNADTTVPFDSSVHYDAIEVSAKTETIPESLKSMKGENYYSNFDTKTNLNANVESPETAKENVLKYAGRLNQGDFKWTFTEANDSSHDIDSSLKQATNDYKSKLVKTNISGDAGGSDSGSSTDPGTTPGGSTPTPTPTPAGKTIVSLVDASGNVNPSASFVTTTCAKNGNDSNGARTVTYEGVTYTTVKFESDKTITVKVEAGKTVTVVGSMPTGTQKCFKLNGTDVKLDAQTTELTTFVKTFTATGNDILSKADKAAIACIIIE